MKNEHLLISCHKYCQLLLLDCKTKCFMVAAIMLIGFTSCTFSQSSESPTDNEIIVDLPPPETSGHKAEPIPFKGENIEFYALSPKFQYAVYNGPYAYSVDQQDTVWTYIDEKGYIIHSFDVDLHNRLMQEGKLRFVLREMGKPGGKRLKGIQYADIMALKAQVADQQTTIELPFAPETFVVVPLGVSEAFKKELEAKIGKPIPEGVVACFQLDKLSSVLNLSPDDLNRVKLVNKN